MEEFQYWTQMESFHGKSKWMYTIHGQEGSEPEEPSQKIDWVVFKVMAEILGEIVQLESLG